MHCGIEAAVFEIPSSIQRFFLLESTDDSGEQDMGRTSQDSTDIQMPSM